MGSTPARTLLDPASVALLGALLGAFSSGCAHAVESAREERVVVAVDHARPTVTEVTDAPPVAVTAPASARPRLSQTVTLGQGAPEPIYAGPPPAAPAAGAPSVVVNNNVTVMNGGYGYGGGYGGYGYGGYVSRGAGARDAYGRGPARSAWAPSGWEGAGRTAAPGQTPHVGGNWSPAPSYGPRQMK